MGVNPQLEKIFDEKLMEGRELLNAD